MATRPRMRPTGVAERVAQFDLSTTLSREHQRLMTANHRAVNWSRSTAGKLPPAMRASLGDLWRDVMEAEHRSAGIFATFVLDLMGAGAPREVLSVACRAALDEVRHAELSARLAELYSGRAEAPAPAIPRVFDDPALSLDEQAVRQALFLSVGAETFSAVSLADQLDGADDPVVRDVLSVILSDEIHHARLGWSWLAARVRDPVLAGPTRAAIAQHVVPVFDDLVRSLFEDPTALPPPSYRGRNAALARAHGYVPVRVTYARFLDTIAAVWLPGLASLGVNASALRGRYPAAKWTRARPALAERLAR